MSAELVGYTNKENEEKMNMEGIDNSAFTSSDVKLKDLEQYNGSPYKQKNGGTNGTVHPDDGEIEEDGKKKTKEKEKKEEVKTVGPFEIFNFADKLDVFMMIIGTIFACAHGAGMPLMMIIFGDMTDSFINDGLFEKWLGLTNLTSMRNDIIGNSSILQNAVNVLIEMNVTPGPVDVSTFVPVDTLTERMQLFAIYYIAIGCGILVSAYFQVTFWMLPAERQTRRIRTHFFRSILRQNIGWFDTHEIGELNTRLTDDVIQIHDGIGDKMGSFFQGMAGFLAGFIIGFVKGWKLTLVILAVSPALALAAIIMSKLTALSTSSELSAYAKAGAVAEEVLGGIRTVVAFGGEKKEIQRYNANLVDAKTAGIKKGWIGGAGMAFVMAVMFACYALGFWYGGTLVQQEPENYTAGTMMIVFFCILIGAFSIGQAAPNLQNMATARGAAYPIFEIIARIPPIDWDTEEGLKPDRVIGNIELRNIQFYYPSRPEIQVMNNFNLQVSVGQTVALVGPSGCGKSTTVQLLQRFYDPIEGEVLLDGVNVKELNLKWLRQHIGIVSQEPVLFDTTIAENIRYGRDSVSDAEIEKACKMANAHDFISHLPNKYETMVGERGAQLSGGQKQRIAIARALVRDPKILLLDEATSALDTESEAMVQAALDKAREGRTTIIIAHRLSTVKTADVIAGITGGEVIEKGTHDELMASEGLYHQLVTNQTQKKSTEDDSEDEDPDAAEVELAFERTMSGRLVKRTLSQPTSPEKHLDRSMSAQKAERLFSVTSGGSGEEEEEEEEKIPEVSMSRIMKMNAPEWYFIVVGCFSSLINGAVMPCFAIIFSEILGVFAEVDKEKQTREITLYSLLFLAIGVGNGLGILFQMGMFGISGEYLTMRIREAAFKAMLRQDIAYFDDKRNNTGALTTRLATEASTIQGATGTRIGGLLQNLSNMGVALVIAFVYSWRLTLVILAFTPFIAVAGFVEMKIFQGAAAKDKGALEFAGKVAVEGIGNIRTVASLTKEDAFYKIYCDRLSGPFKNSLKKAHLVGFVFGFSQCVIFFAYAAAFTYGGYLVEESQKDLNDDLDVNFIDVIKVFSAIVFGAMALGQASSFAPDFGKAKTSANRIFYLLDRVPPIDTYSEDGEQQAAVSGSVEFKDVVFNYPTRASVKILRGLNLSVNAGETLALVGSSGCGKSTSVQLIERFYDTLTGNVNLDGKDIKNLNLSWLRSQIGIVSQEPVLFDRSIKDNIAYGDNSREPGMDEIIAAARAANIHSFIAELPDGYDTSVGDKGTQLSGGQKQRIAIARALLRNPKILLLDEATSALDTESEKVVQEALDKAQEGRTSIVIAHRLSTIINADKIAVIHRGRVVELGTHNQLLSKQGFYYRLNNAQLIQS